eukprot:3541559-Amphidinium_carterae.1
MEVSPASSTSEGNKKQILGSTRVHHRVPNQTHTAQTQETCCLMPKWRQDVSIREHTNDDQLIQDRLLQNIRGPAELQPSSPPAHLATGTAEPWCGSASPRTVL